MLFAPASKPFLVSPELSQRKVVIHRVFVLALCTQSFSKHCNVNTKTFIITLNFRREGAVGEDIDSKQSLLNCFYKLSSGLPEVLNEKSVDYKANCRMGFSPLRIKLQ